jgi:hypothetical protein
MNHNYKILPDFYSNISNNNNNKKKNKEYSKYFSFDPELTII